MSMNTRCLFLVFLLWFKGKEQGIMVIGSVLLAIATTLSNGLSNYAQGNELASINKQAQDIIATGSRFSYENFNFNYDQQQNIVKQKLVDYNRENELYDLNYLEKITTELESDTSYVDLKDLKDEFELPYSVFSISEGNNAYTASFDDKFKNDFENVGGGGTSNNSSSNNKQDSLPILPVNSQKVAVIINGKLFGKDFFGLLATPEACIGVYNIISNFLNNYNFYDETRKFVVDLMEKYAPPMFMQVYTSLVGVFTTMWSKFVALFSASAPPYSLALGIIIGTFGFICISIIVSMFIFGRFGKGYAAGFIIHNMVWWEPYAGIL